MSPRTNPGPAQLPDPPPRPDPAAVDPVPTDRPPAPPEPAGQPPRDRVGAGPPRGRAPGARLRGDRGQAGLLVALVALAVATLAAALMASLGGAVAERTRARTAADAAALAGVVGGRSAAKEVARANGGRLEGFVVDGEAVEATVVVGSTRASSRAVPARRRARLGPWVPAHPPDLTGWTGIWPEPAFGAHPGRRR